VTSGTSCSRVRVPSNPKSPCCGFFSVATKSGEGTPIKNKWKVSDVQVLEGDLLFVVALYDQKGRPYVSLVYRTEAEASTGRDQRGSSAEKRGGGSW
jgi:hypothetical protein